MPAIFSGLVSDLPTLITNVSLVIIFAGAIAAGIVRGLKEWREFKKPAAAAPNTTSQIAAVTLLENVTLAEWTRSNKEVVVAVGRVCDMLAKTVDEMADLRRSVEDVQHELKRGTR